MEDNEKKDLPSDTQQTDDKYGDPMSYYHPETYKPIAVDEEEDNGVSVTIIKRNFVIRNLLVLLVSIMMILVAFLPVVNVPPYDSEYPTDMKISLLDGVLLFTDTLRSDSMEEISESKLFKRGLELSEEIDRDISKYPVKDGIAEVPSEVADKIGEFFFISARIQARLESVKVTPGLIFMCAAAVVYCMFTVVTFITALVSLISSISGNLRFTASLRRVCFAPVMIFATCYAYKATFKKSSFAFFPLYVIGITAAVLVVFGIFHFVSSKEQRHGNVRRLIAAILSCLAIVSAVIFPVMTVTVNTKFAGSGENTEAACDIYTDDFWMFSSNSETRGEFLHTSTEKLRSNVNSYFKNYCDYTEKDFVSGKANLITGNILINLCSVYIRGRSIDVITDFVIISELFSAVIYFVIIMCGMIFSGNMAEICGGFYNGSNVNSGKIFSIIFTVVAAGIISVMIYLFTANNVPLLFDGSSGVGASDFKLSFTYGLIVLMFINVVTACIPTGKKKKKALN